MLSSDKLGFPGDSVKNLPAKQGTGVWPLGREDPLEEETAAHSSILAWEMPWTEAAGGLQSMGLKESDTTEQLTLSLSVTTWRSWDLNPGSLAPESAPLTNKMIASH